MLWPWPPVTVSARPAARIRGPGTRPAATARATSMLAPPIPPRSRTVVTPASRFLLALTIAFSAANPGVVRSRASFSKSASPSNWRCTWTSIRPGIKVFPSPSTSRASRASFGGRVMRADPLDPLGPEEHPLALPDPVPVEDGDVRDVGGLRHRSIMPPEMSAQTLRSSLAIPARGGIDARRRDHASGREDRESPGFLRRRREGDADPRHLLGRGARRQAPRGHRHRARHREPRGGGR